MTTATDLRAVSRRLNDRIMDIMPVDHLLFGKLMSLMSIEASDEVATAGVTLGARSRLLLNPSFVAEHCPDDASLVMLVLHELAHIQMGHTRLHKEATPAQNVAFDALINAQLSRSLPDTASLRILRKLYRPDVFPEALLRPPEGWGEAMLVPRWRLTGAQRQVHEALYESACSATEDEILELLARPHDRDTSDGSDDGGDGAAVDQAPDTCHGFDPSRLLGSHGLGADGSAPDPELIDAASEILSACREASSLKRRSPMQTAARYDVDLLEARRQTVRVIRRALRHVADAGHSAAPVAEWSRTDVEGLLPYRTTADRRNDVLALLGCATLLHRTNVEVPRPERLEKTHIYLDVSGSMNEIIALMYGAVRPLLHLIHDSIHLFSESINDITPQELRKGRVATQWGTNITAVTQHMVENEVERAVIITDGYVGNIPFDHVEVLRRRKVKLSVVLTCPRGSGFAAVLGAREFLLPVFQ